MDGTGGAEEGRQDVPVDTEKEGEHPADGWMDAEVCERERERANERRKKSVVVPVVG